MTAATPSSGAGWVAREPSTELTAVPPSRANRFKNIGLYMALGWLVLVIVGAVAAPFLPLNNPKIPIGRPRIAPGLRWPEFLGTDEVGRSELSRILSGARASMAVGVLSVTIAFTLGGLLGTIAGYWRGRVDQVVSVVVDAVLSFPPLVLLLALAAMLQPSLETVVIGLAVVFTPSFARLARATTMKLRSEPFVLACRVGGASRWRVMFRELLPNVAVPLLAYAFLVAALAIVAEGSLSFLGYGIPAPAPSWGGMIARGRQYLRDYPHLVFVPALALMFTVFALNTVGDALRERLEGSDLSR